MSEACSRPPRTIVLCFDGTNDQYSASNTNVVRFFRLLRKDCQDRQMVYYQPGIGTYYAPGVVSPLLTSLASLMDEAVAWYLDAHVIAGYKYLMDNYRTGDKICLFGFSRGAYTARALAGLLYKIGLLPKGNLEHVNFAYKLYKRTDKEGVELAAGFKKTFSQDVKVEFIGVWDTVQSTGMLVNRELPFSDSNTSIKVFRHALSLDEHRSRFRPNLYHWSSPNQDESTGLIGLVARIFNAIGPTFIGLFKRKNTTSQSDKIAIQGSSANGAQQDARRDGATTETQPDAVFVAEELSPETDVLEVWFSGCHSDVGGGSVADSIMVSLAQITLHWMVEHVIESGCGILFDDDQLSSIGFRVMSPSTKQDVKDVGSSVLQESPSEASQPTSSSETYVEHADAIAPLYDQLQLSMPWWILEVLPYTDAWQDSNGKWHSKFMIGFGRGRLIPFQKPKFHHTVKERMDCASLKYKPKALYDQDVVYV